MNKQSVLNETLLKDALDRDVKSILMLLNIETKEEILLHEFDYLIEAPQFRSDFELFYNSRGLIYSYNINDGTHKRVDTGYCIYCNNDHVLSPDRTKLAVSHFTKEDCSSRIYIIDLLKKTAPFLVTPLSPSYLHGWSPDGRTLAYCAERNNAYNIFVIPADGGEETALTNEPDKSDGPEYSPDGRYIYFNAIRNGCMDCYRMDADGRHPVRLTDNGRYNWFPHISPDGSQVVYLSFDPAEIDVDDHPANKHVQLRMMGPDGQKDQILLELFGGQGTINVNSWSPDSRYIAFVKYTL